MDSANIKLQFLDLDGADEQEKHEIEGILFTPGWQIKLPWGTRCEPEENQGEAAVAQLQEQEQETAASCEAELIHDHQHEEHNHGEWIQQYEEQEMVQDGTMEPMPPAPPMRGPMYPYMVMTPAMGMPPYPMQYMPPQTHYAAPAYYNEAEPPQNRMRGGKGRDKHQQQPMQPPHQPYVQSYMPMMQFVPAYMSEFPQPTYQLHPDQPPFHPDPQFHQHHHPQVELEPPPKIENQPPPAPIEHLCYTTDVTVKAPKKKQPEEVAPAVPKIEAHSVPVVAQTVPPVLPPEVPAAPVPTVAPVPVTVPIPTSAPQPAPTPAPEIVPEPPQKELPPTPVTQEATEQPLSPPPVREEPKAPEYPRLNGTATAVLSQPPNKTWAKLFEAQAPSPIGVAGAPQSISVKPLARVPPAPRQIPSVGDATNYDIGKTAPTVPSPVNFNAKLDYRITDDPYTVRLVSKLREAKLDHRAVNLTPRGLTNPSNYCYVNAILQALIACPPLFNLLKSLPVPQDPRQAARTPIIGSMIELVQQFHQLPSKIKRREKSSRAETPDLPSGTSFEPRCVYKVLDKIRGDSSFSVEGRQEDAEEFLSCLLNGLNDEMFEVMKLMGGEPAEVVVTEMTNGDAGSDSESATQEWKVMGPKNRGAITRRAVCGNTPISEIFRGQQRSRVVREGGDNTDSVQPFFTLQLDVEKAVSVKQALDLLMNKDVLEGMTCSRTHREIEAWTQTTLEELPLILTLHLKCFDYKHDGCSKITKIVDYSVDLKIESKLVTGNKGKYTSKQKSYKLIAVVYHDGKEANKGHYITDVYHVGLGLWIRYDDGNVRCVKEEHVLRPISPRVPYLLFYRRSDTASTASPAPPPPAAPVKS